MNHHSLDEPTARALVAPDKGILAADESTVTTKKHLDGIQVQYFRISCPEGVLTEAEASEMGRAGGKFGRTEVEPTGTNRRDYCALTFSTPVVKAAIAMNKLGPQPREISFSYGRALRQSVLAIWRSQATDAEATQRAFYHRSECNDTACYKEKFSREKPSRSRPPLEG